MKKWLKILLLIFGGLVLLILCLAGYGYYNYWAKYPVDKQKYPHEIGCLDPSNPDMNDEFQRCEPGKKPAGYYHSAFKYAYKNNPTKFKRSVISFFNKEGNYIDSGVLGIRFLIDCNGNIGDYEINEMDVNYDLKALNRNMVDLLLKFCLDKKHWKGIKDRDTYMYLIIRLEHGKILEILP
ncbi:MAG: hypothetical protein AAGA86_03930 [Bacteroidota bacterium]